MHKPPRSPFAAGEGIIAGRYALRRRLGTGSLGTVYLAWDAVQKRQVALKVIRTERMAPEAVASIQIEFRAIASLHHPQIATAYDFGYTETGLPFYTRIRVRRSPAGRASRLGDPRGVSPALPPPSRCSRRVSLADLLALRRYLFIAGPEPTCIDAADADDGQEVEGCPGCTPGDGQVNISDAILFVRYLLIEEDWWATPRAPFPEVGPDPTEDPLTCSSYDIVPPEVSGDTVRLGEVEASPGEVVEIPVYLSNTVPVEAMQLVIEYDSELIAPLDGRDGVTYEGTIYEEFDSSRSDVTWVFHHDAKARSFDLIDLGAAQK